MSNSKGATAEQKTAEASAALDTAITEAISNYSKATAALFNVLMEDNGGKATAALGGLWIVCHNVEHDILRQLRAGAKSAAGRKGQR